MNTTYIDGITKFVHGLKIHIPSVSEDLLSFLMGRSDSTQPTCIYRFSKFAGLQIRVRIENLFSLFLIQNICCGYSKEPSQ